MTAQELQDWLAKHGGIDDTATTRSQVGQDIIFAKDGSRVVLTRVTPDTYRVDDITEKDAAGNVTATAPASQQPAAPDAAPAPPAPAAPAQPSSGVGPTSKEALEGRVGQTPGLVYQGQKLVPKTIPSKYPGQPDQHIQVPTVTWVNPATGYTISAEVGPNGDTYTVTTDGVVEANMQPNAPGAKKTPPSGKPYIDDGPEAGKTGRRWGWNPETGAYDRDLGSSPAAQAAEQGASNRQPVQGQPGYSLVTTEKDGKKESHYEKDDAPGVAVSLPTSTPQQDDTTVVSTGYEGLGQQRVKVTTYKSGRVQRDAAPTTAQPRSVRYETRGGKQVKVTTLDDNTETTEEAAPSKDGFAGEPADAPPMDVTPGQVTAGLQKYSSYLSTQVKLYRDSGGKQGVSPEDATKLMNQRISLAEGALREQQNTVSTQTNLLTNATTQRRDTLTDTSNRRVAAGNSQQLALNTFVPLATKLGPGGAPLLNAAINNTQSAALANAGAWGGMRESPEVGLDSFPALAQMRQAGLAGIQTAANGGPQIFDARPPAGVTSPAPDATAAAAEAARQQGMAAGSAAPPPAMQNAGQGTGEPPARGNPTTPPPAPPGQPSRGPYDVMPDTPGTPPATPEPVPLAPAEDPLRRNDPRTQPLSQSPVDSPPYANPISGEPIAFKPLQDMRMALDNPNIAPPSVMPSREQMLALADRVPNLMNRPDGPETYDAGGGITPAPRFMQEAQYGQGNYWRPDVHGVQLAQRLGIPDDIFKQAVSGLYG